MKVAFVSLARLGDLTNCLPICRDCHQKGDQVFFLHDARLSSLFTGVSYVTSVPVRQIHLRVRDVIERARPDYDLVLDAHPFGPTYKGLCDLPHNVRAWVSCGFTVENFYDRAGFPLVFDRRDPEREKFLARHIRGEQPLIVLSLTAKSSVFNQRHRLALAIRERWGHQCEILDLATIKAGRFFDLLGIIDRAAILVTVDTSAMHLAVASKVPAICLIGDNRNTAAEPRCNVALKLKYSEWVKRIKEIHQKISVAIRNPMA